MKANNIPQLITQVRTSYFSFDCGMAYIIRLGDGSFVMIDGNIGEYDEPLRLMELLDEQNVTGEKPRIAAWFITHEHGDHYQGFINFTRLYGDRVTVENILYDFPPKELYWEGVDRTAFNEAVQYYTDRGARVLTPKSGERYEFADATFDMIYSYRDLGDERPADMNNCSLSMIMTLCGLRTMWFGDIEPQAAKNILSRYSVEELKCDIMQVAHHGYTGASDPLYRAVDPTVVLWPCPDFWYHPGCRWKCNDYLAHSSENIKATFVAGQGETVLDLTKPIEPSSPYTYGKVTADIAAGRMCALHWTCLTGGGRGYMAMKLTYPEAGTCRLEAGDARSLCQMIQRGQTALSNKYRFTFSGVLEGAETFGLILDNATPMEWNDEKLITLDQKPDVPFEYTVETDRAAGRAEIYEGGRRVMTVEGLSGEPCDVIIMMKNGAVRLAGVEFENVD